jgi:hypothetical protein
LHQESEKMQEQMSKIGIPQTYLLGFSEHWAFHQRIAILFFVKMGDSTILHQNTGSLVFVFLKMA